jgi:hypothetical protein
MMCGTLTCQQPNVCCLQKIAPYFSCVPLSDFTMDNCEKPPPVTPSCTVPSDCDGGAVCCLQYATFSINCQAPDVCTGPSNYVACATDRDCPTQKVGSCTPLGGADAGYGVNLCPPSQ